MKPTDRKAMTTMAKQRAHYCIDHGHSKLVSVDWGRVYCARCEACLGDSLTQMLDSSKWVFWEKEFPCFGCETCRANATKLTKHDLALLPRRVLGSLKKLQDSNSEC